MTVMPKVSESANPVVESKTHKHTVNYPSKSASAPSSTVEESGSKRNEYIRVLYTNADVLTNKIDLLRARCQAELPSIVAVNEVKAKNSRFKVFRAEFNVEDLGYDMFPNNIEENVGRGQLMYVSKELNAKGVYFESSFEEVTCVKIDLENNDKLMVMLMYRSPDSTDTNNLLMNNFIDKACKSGASHLLSLRDYNFPKIDWKSSFSNDPTEIAFVDKLFEHGLHQHVGQATRQRGCDTPNILDLIISKEETNIDDIEYKSPLGKSDHYTILFEYRSYAKISSDVRTIPLPHKADYENMKEEFKKLRDEFFSLPSSVNTEEKWKFFSRRYDQIVTENTPTVRKKRIFPVPLDRKIRENIKEKDKLSRKLIELKKQHKLGPYD